MEARTAAHAITVSTRRAFLTSHPLLKSAAHVIPHARITTLSTVQLYAVDGDVSPQTLEKLRDMVTHPITEEGAINSVSTTRTTTCAFVVGFLPGVTDNVGKTVESLLADIDPRAAQRTRIYSSTLYCIEGDCSQEDAARLAETVFNPVIQYAKVLTSTELAHFIPIPARVALHETGTYTVVALRTLSDDALTQLGKQGIPNTDGTTRGPLALSLHDMKTIQAYFIRERRDPTDVELESIAQTWSEHCKHTIFSDPIGNISGGIYRKYIKGATQYIRKKKGVKDICVSVFSDNAGGIAFTKDYLVTHKVETHNSPSALDPFGGAITGIVGVNRDTLGFGLGAKPIANVYGFCVGHPHDETMYYRAPHKGNPLLSALRILDGVVKGVGSGGNESGIPTPVGFVSVDARYRGKPLVFAGTVGLIPRRIGKKLSHKKAAQSGDYVVVAGGRVGLDGIHGATFSSEALESGSPATAVQIGDPITQKKLSDAMLTELRDAGLYTSVTDNGAGGISCSVAEMAKECGGAIVDLSKVPTKYPGLAPWQMWISESQERMTFSVPKRSWRAFERIMKRYGAEAAVIGTFTKEKRCVVTVGKRTVMNLSMEFLHNGRVPRQQVLREPESTTPVALPKDARTHRESILELLKTPGVGTYLPITEQYDHEVQATSVTKPVQGPGRVNADAGVLKPLRTSERGVVLSASLRHSRTPKDAYAFSALAIDEAISSAIAAGAHLESIALLDNYCWSSSTQPERLWELVQSTRACYEIATTYLTPFISGKDSMFNDFRGYTSAGEPIHIAAPPTLLISAIGQMDSVIHAQTLDVKNAGDSIFLLGETQDALALSEYMVMLGARSDTSYSGARLPHVDAQKNSRLYRVAERCISKGFVNAAYAPNRGGLAVALMKMAVAGKRGITVRIPHVTSTVNSLFAECGGRIVVTVPKRHEARFIAACKGITCTKLGTVSDAEMCIFTTKEGDIRISVTEAYESYMSALTI